MHDMSSGVVNAVEGQRGAGDGMQGASDKCKLCRRKSVQRPCSRSMLRVFEEHSVAHTECVRR